MAIPPLLPADIILSQSNNWLGKTIRWFEEQRTGAARVNHASLALGNLTEEPEVIESLFRVKRGPLSNYEGRPIIIYRMKGLSAAKRSEIVLKAVSIERQGYGVWKLPLFAMDSVFKTYFFTSNFGIGSFKVCSQMVAWAYEKVLGTKPFGVGWRSATPDILDDYASHGKLNWETVYSTL